MRAEAEGERVWPREVAIRGLRNRVLEARYPFSVSGPRIGVNTRALRVVRSSTRHSWPCVGGGRGDV